LRGSAEAVAGGREERRKGRKKRREMSERGQEERKGHRNKCQGSLIETNFSHLPREL
jgi:hypothetical protein